MSKKPVYSLIAGLPDTEQKLAAWITLEIDFWSKIFPRIITQNSLFDSDSVLSYMNSLSVFSKPHSGKKAIDSVEIKRILDSFRETNLPHHDDEISNRLSRLGDDTGAIQQTLYYYTISRISFDSLLREEYFTKYGGLIHDGVVQIEELSSYYSDLHQKVLATTESSRAALESHTALLSDQLSKDSDELTGTQKTLLLELSSTIQKEIRSNEPVKFWEGKEARHSAQAKKCRWTAIGLGVCASLVLSLLIFAAFKDQDTTTLLGFKIPNHFYVAVSIIVGSAFVWALKISIQLMMTHVALEAEALEKSTAIKTYVALSDQIKDMEIEKEFHKSLLTFNKIKVAEDSNHPELIKLIEQFLSKRKENN